MDTKKLYPVAERIPLEDVERLGLKRAKPGSAPDPDQIGQPLISMGMPARNVHAQATGEFRAPKRGEWYLSGAIVEAYRAPNDLTQEFHIAKLVRTVTRTVTTVTPVSEWKPTGTGGRYRHVWHGGERGDVEREVE